MLHIVSRSVHSAALLLTHSVSTGSKLPRLAHSDPASLATGRTQSCRELHIYRCIGTSGAALTGVSAVRGQSG